MANITLGITKAGELKCTALLSPGEVRSLVAVARQMGVLVAADAPPTIEVAQPDAGETPPRPGSSTD